MRLFLGVTVLVSVGSLGCAANGGGGGGPDGGTPPVSCIDDRDCGSYVCDLDLRQCVPPESMRIPCMTDDDCPGDYTCEVRGTVRICIAPDIFAPMCEDCPAPFECRDGICFMPDETGAVCEFDPECEEGELCIAGRCTWDPRLPRPCELDADCPSGLECSMEGSCVCDERADCPSGTYCAADGSCRPEDGGCIGDDECPLGTFCDRGMCLGEAACDVVHPDLETDPVWNVSSTYNFREALPGWLSTTLDLVAGPARFLAGDSDYPELGLPDALEIAIGALINDAVRDWVDTYLPPYAQDALSAVGTINDLLSTWAVQERMRLTAQSARDSYIGSSEWVEVSFELNGEVVRGNPRDLIGWTTTPADFNARAVCGTLNIERHDVEIGIGSVIAWAIDAAVYEASDHNYRGIGDLARTFRAQFCAYINGFAETHKPGWGDDAEMWCNTALNLLIDQMEMALQEALLRLDLVKLKGNAVIVDGSRLDPGVWEGSLLGGDFSGSWTGTR